jgi:REP element-mobilizing transposase RayT
LIRPEIEKTVFSLVTNELREISCPVRIINGVMDHIHCLFLLNPQKSIIEITKQIKGASSHAINQANISVEKFAWQTGYAAYSVSESALDKVFEYIKNQKQHHYKRSFQQEYEEFIRLHQLNENG